LGNQNTRTRTQNPGKIGSGKNRVANPGPTHHIIIIATNQIHQEKNPSMKAINATLQNITT
jgi:hypothetical protein